MSETQIEPIEQGNAVVPLVCYVASGLGFTGEGRYFYKHVVLPSLRALGLDLRDPWEMTAVEEARSVMSPSLAADRERQYERFETVVGIRNAQAINGAHVVIANLNGTDVDAGVASEIGYAAARGIPCYCWRDDWRNSGELVGRIALQVAYLVELSGGFVHFGEFEQFVEKVSEELEVLRDKLADSE